MVRRERRFDYRCLWCCHRRFCCGSRATTHNKWPGRHPRPDKPVTFGIHAKFAVNVICTMHIDWKGKEVLDRQVYTHIKKRHRKRGEPNSVTSLENKGGRGDDGGGCASTWSARICRALVRTTSFCLFSLYPLKKDWRRPKMAIFISFRWRRDHGWLRSRHRYWIVSDQPAPDLHCRFGSAWLSSATSYC